MINIAVFVSGNGTNCENIIKYFQDDNDINISLVISNRQDAYALKRAAKLYARHLFRFLTILYM